MALPHFLIAGVPKAGTTALHAALVRHPDLFLPSVKEPKFFLTDGPPPTRGGPGDAQTYQEHVWRREDYERLFDPAPPGALRGEATPFYLHHLDSHARIHRLVPDAKIILLLRDPVDRAHSNWTHLWTAGLEPEADFLTACRLEDQRKAAGWAAFWHYLDLGRYGAQVKHLYEYFPASRCCSCATWSCGRHPRRPWTRCARSSASTPASSTSSPPRTSPAPWTTPASTPRCATCCAPVPGSGSTFPYPCARSSGARC
ncbi:sulfotransferase family protein [Phytohabitans houttuyneae]|uniref:Sulfotransferase domain-containing protein n=1 Tax=Phytohabitans houttuyneae TaxID=1076126 RepID=A0A6V8KPS4_9ACTN|nr:sulfotransferase [Phytohabitans houttuyneae]GFJ84371.1 hypothetical protein Phou_085510 [Phytohabitans houttuyneae]